MTATSLNFTLWLNDLKHFGLLTFQVLNFIILVFNNLFLLLIFLIKDSILFFKSRFGQP